MIALGGAFFSPALARAELSSEASIRRSVDHAFWDQGNVALFAGVGASRMFDYASTRHFRRRGVNEILLTNEIVDDKPLFLGIEIAGTAASMGVSAWLHHHGHHKLERWLSVTHIGITTFGAVRNYKLRSTGAVDRAGQAVRR